jgi:hypothetical protein
MKKNFLLLSSFLLAIGSLQAAPTYRIFGTREGLVGGTTANGHVIASHDHFCALPSGQALNSLGGRTYTVTINNPANGRTSSNVPVWDIGPWNTKDNYWHVPRQMWTDLPKGKPEAQAAYQDGYNGGRDMFGRSVANPAGIDLADGTFWDDLGMSDNGWVDVTYNWEDGGSGGVAGRIDVFTRGGNNNVYQKYWNDGSGWSAGFSNKGGSLSGDPTCVSWGPNRLDVFGRGTDGSLQHLYWNGSTWSSWENLGGGFVGNPDVCSWGANRLDVFARNSAGNLIHKWYSGSGNWSGWEDLSGPIASDPAAVAWGPGRIDVFARGLGNTLKHIYYTGSGNWSWEDKGGALSGGPDACSYTSGRFDVFCRNASGNLLQIYFGSGGWSSWVNLGGTLYSDPGCTSHADRRINVFGKGGDASLYENFFDGDSWSGWHTMGGTLTSGPDACSWSNTAGTR